jgi:hypothetical protein
MGVLVFLLDEAKVDFALLLWDGIWGGKSSTTPMGGGFCGADFARGRSRMCTGLKCSGSTFRNDNLNCLRVRLLKARRLGPAFGSSYDCQ